MKPPLSQVLNQHREAFVLALVAAFPSVDDLTEMVSYGLNKNLNAMVDSGALRHRVFQLVRHAEAEGWVDELLAAARARNPGNPALRTLAEKVGPASPLSGSSGAWNGSGTGASAPAPRPSPAMPHAATTQLFESWRNGVAEDRTRETLNEMRSYLAGRMPGLYNETLLRLRDLTAIDKDERAGFSTHEQARVERRQLVDRVLQLVDAIERESARFSLAQPFEQEPVQFPTPPPAAALEVIIGANNLKRIFWLQMGLDAARSVCRVTTMNGVGSGFLIEGGRLLTNQHVIPDEKTAGTALVEFNVEESQSGQLTTPVGYNLDASSLRVNAALDCAVVKLIDKPGAPLSAWGSLSLEGGRTPTAGEHVTIIQHPAGGPKQIALTANQVVNARGIHVQYSTDTLGGSSGSPVFNDAWRVIALHHMGGNIVADAAGKKVYANQGVLMSEIMKWLAGGP